MLEYKEILRINSNQKGVPGYVYQSGPDYFWAQSSGNLTIFPYVPVRNMINELVPELITPYVLTAAAIISVLGYTPVPDTRSINTIAPLTGGGNLTADLTLSTQMNTNKLIGRYSSGTGVFEEITIGSNLSLVGNTLNSTVGTIGTLLQVLTAGNNAGQIPIVNAYTIQFGVGGLLLDNYTTIAVDILARILNDKSGHNSIDFDNRYLVNSSNVVVINWKGHNGSPFNIPNCPKYNNDGAAGAAGLVAGDVYQDNSGHLCLKQ